MRSWLIALALSGVAPAGAQQAPVALVPAPALPLLAAPPPLTSEDLLAFALAEGRMTVPVTLADTDARTHRFVIDTGAERTVISRELARELGLPSGRAVRMTSMTGVDIVATALVPSIRVSTLGGERIEAPALSGIDLGAPGMLGIDALQGHMLSIDFDALTMAVVPSDRRKRRHTPAPGEIVVEARSLFGQLVVTDAYCGGQRVRIVLDTGSPISVGNEALRRRMMHERTLTPVTVTGVTGVEITLDHTALREVRLGDLVMRELPVAFGDLPPFRRFGLETTPAILLGMDVLRLFRRVSIDFANRQVRFQLPRGAGRAA